MEKPCYELWVFPCVLTCSIHRCLSVKGSWELLHMSQIAGLEAPKEGVREGWVSSNRGSCG